MEYIEFIFTCSIWSTISNWTLEDQFQIFKDLYSFKKTQSLADAFVYP